VLMYREWQPVADAWRLILANVRDQESSRGDMQAMFGSLKIGERRLLEFTQRYGVDTFRLMLKEIKRYSEQRMRRDLEAIPDGTYQFVTWLEDDGHTLEPLAIAVSVTISGSDAIVDFNG